MRITLVGSRHFGVTTLNMLREHGVGIVRVVVADADDRLAATAKAAVEWTIKEGDRIAGGTIYHLADRMDAGAIAAQDWCFVKKGETARELWERALAPLGLKLLADVIDYAKVHKALPAKTQDEQFATSAPSLS